MNRTSVQIQAALAANLRYFWQIKLDNGKIISQFDPESGATQSIGNFAEILVKPVGDKYQGSFAFKGIKEAYWIPVAVEGHVHGVGIGKGEAIVLYRQGRHRTTGTSYCVYCIGVRYEGPLEETFYICPPVRYLKTVNSWIDEEWGDFIVEADPHYFSGCVDRSTDPLPVLTFDKFTQSLS